MDLKTIELKIEPYYCSEFESENCDSNKGDNNIDEEDNLEVKKSLY